MKVKELIEKLQTYDPEMLVLHGDSEYGDELISIDEDKYQLYRENKEADVLVIREKYENITLDMIDPKHLHEKPPVQTQCIDLPSGLRQAFETYISESVVEGTIVFTSKENLPPDAQYVEFPIHVTRNYERPKIED